MMTSMTSSALDLELATARQRVADLVPDLATVDFDNDPHELAAWLDRAAGAAIRREFVLADDSDPRTLYLWMNDFVVDLDRWCLTPFANGPERPARSNFDWRDALIGEEIGSGLRVPDLTLAGMEHVQTWFHQPADAAEGSAVEDVVLMAAFDLVARSLPHSKHVPFRVAMSRSEEWRVCTWDTAEAAAQLHTWESGAA